jgi:acetyl-CoA synthetase
MRKFKFCPLFSAFGSEPICQRLSKGDAKVLVTTGRFYKQKIAALRERLPQLQHILLIDAPEDIGPGLWSLPKRMQEASETFTIPPTDLEDMATVHFASGTTGMPKGAVHVHEAVLTHYMTGKLVLDYHHGDVRN